MPTLLRSSVLVLAGVLMSACVADGPYQAGADGTLHAPVDAGVDTGYVLSHVEFDDQGWFQDMRQRQALFAKLQTLHREKKSMLIVAYTHGWKHNAKEGDSNLDDFRKLLTQLTTIERASKRPSGPRTVVGVYIGWRGSTIPIPIVENITFWTRKNAAERVGGRSIKQLFVELNQFRAYANGWSASDQLAESRETQLVFIGHSFGGLVTYTALHSAILERGLQLDHAGNYRTAKSFGDFVLLVNPAFEGASYEPIWQAALSRGCYPRWQRPVMAIVTSRADRATRLAFPAGRLYTLAQSAPHEGERETVMHTVGHLDRYRTHQLEMTKDIGPPRPSADADRASTGPSTTLGPFRLTQAERPRILPPVPKHMPYLVIQAGPELIADHNDFWNDHFRDFTVRFISKHVLKPQETAATTERPATDGCPAFGAPAPVETAGLPQAR
ncbi:hypothetical protein [Massilia sp. HP4]|uniref:hypothetical protein n=1 Tax=Massilia sp. HP4 TaxID=2562316 RepID=UPI0010BFBE26|nr:hypothetical protein [Massilia sp. HP4]